MFGFPNSICLRNYFFSLCVLNSCQSSDERTCRGLFLGFLFYSIGLHVSMFLHQYHAFDYCDFIIFFDNKNCDASSFVLSEDYFG